MIKSLKIVIIVIVIFILTGCAFELKNIKVTDPLTEEQIITYVENEIYNDTKDKVKVKIVSKEQKYSCAVALFNASCIYKQEMEGVHEYKLEIENTGSVPIKTTGTYIDGYIEYDSKETNIIPSSFKSDYSELKGLVLVKEELTNILNEKNILYKMYNDVSNFRGYDIFLSSSDYDVLYDIFSNFNNIIIKYKNIVDVTFSVYIYKDENAYNNTDFSLYSKIKKVFGGQSYGKDILEELSKKEVSKISIDKGFSKEMFASNVSTEIINNEEEESKGLYSYLVFLYQSDPSLVKDFGTIQLFGVK